MSTSKKPKSKPVVTTSTEEFLWKIQSAQLDKKDEEIDQLKKELEEAKDKIAELRIWICRRNIEEEEEEE